MLRVVERVLGEGQLFREGASLFRAGYELTVYRRWHDEGGTLVAGDYEVEGYLVAPAAAVETALGTIAPATLHLDDGRRFDLYVLNGDGAVTSADGRGLYGG
jgi:hypothetical protein